MPGQTWPMWSETEIDAIKLGYLNDIIACKTGFGTFGSLAFAHYLINEVGINSDNYPLYFRMIEAGNRWVVDILVQDKEPAKFFGSIQPNTFMLQECFRMLTQWKAGEVYDKSLRIIYGLLSVCYEIPDEGYRMYPLTVNDVNNLGKHLDKSKDQMDPLNRIVLSVLDRVAGLIEPQKPLPAREVQDVALQSNNIRGKFLDQTKKMNEVIPDILLTRGDFKLTEVAPNVPKITV